MFLRNKASADRKLTPLDKKSAIPTMVAKGTHILGNIIHDGVVDFDGMLDGNIRCTTLTIRENGGIKGEVTADNLFVYGKVNGLVRAKNIVLHSTCHIEGIVMHESLSIEDGAFIDGKCKRTNKPLSDEEDAPDTGDESAIAAESKVKPLENIRLIR